MTQYIRRATTPKQVFTFHIDDMSILDRILITYVQKGKIVLEREKDSLTIEDNTVWFRLTQEETLSLRQKIPVEIQVRALTNDGNALASNVFEVSVERVLNEEVLT